MNTALIRAIVRFLDVVIEQTYEAKYWHKSEPTTSSALDEVLTHLRKAKSRIVDLKELGL
jgi:hypothetical protein